MNLNALGWMLSLCGALILAAAFLWAGAAFVEWVDVLVKDRPAFKVTICPEKERWRP